jgi:hypothetical protein
MRLAHSGCPHARAGGQPPATSRSAGCSARATGTTATRASLWALAPGSRPWRSRWPGAATPRAAAIMAGSPSSLPWASQPWASRGAVRIADAQREGEQRSVVGGQLLGPGCQTAGVLEAAHGPLDDVAPAIRHPVRRRRRQVLAPTVAHVIDPLGEAELHVVLRPTAAPARPPRAERRGRPRQQGGEDAPRGLSQFVTTSHS